MLERMQGVKLPVFLILLCIMLRPVPEVRGEEAQIVFAGVTFAGAMSTMETQYPRLQSEKKNLATLVNVKLKETHFSFRLTDFHGKGINFADAEKEDYDELENPLSLTILITQENLGKDRYHLILKGQPQEIEKMYFDVGLSAIFFTPEGNQDKVEYSIPVIAEDVIIEHLTEAAIQKQFLKTFERALDVLCARLTKVQVRYLEAEVIQSSNGRVVINKGTRDGIGIGTGVNYPGGKGGVVVVEKENAVIDCAGAQLRNGDRVKLYACKSDLDETFQVTDVKISSELGVTTFGETTQFRTLCAQWFSDFLADRSGTVVLPPKAGAVYTVEAKENILHAYHLEGTPFQLKIPDAKNPILLDITGLKKGLLKGNSVNQIWGYKVWIEKDVAGVKTKVSEAIKEEAIVGNKELNDKEIFRETVLQALAKLAKE